MYMKSDTKEAINKYISHGLFPGDFIYSVLTNNLLASASFADEQNAKDLAEIVRYVFEKAPNLAWRTAENIESWIGHHGFKGLEEETNDIRTDTASATR
jgi:hypothetical protein